MFLTFNSRAPQSIFDRTETGTLLNRFSQDMTLIESQLSVAVLLTVYGMPFNTVQFLVFLPLTLC